MDNTSIEETAGLPEVSLTPKGIDALRAVLKVLEAEGCLSTCGICGAQIRALSKTQVKRMKSVIPDFEYEDLGDLCRRCFADRVSS